MQGSIPLHGEITITDIRCLSMERADFTFDFYWTLLFHTEVRVFDETPIPLTLSTKPVLGVPPSVTQTAMWKDALFTPVVPTSRF